MDDFIELAGDPVSVTELSMMKAKALAQALESLNYVSLVGCIRESDGSEVVVFDAEVEIPQNPVHDIRRFERIAVRFDPQDNSVPETIALRSDFPRVPHLNLRQDEHPRSLCVFDEPYVELRLHWTAPFYIRSVREWLALTARGDLHADDQPLEPLLSGSEGILVLPQVVFDWKCPVNVLVIDSVVNSCSQKTYVAAAAKSIGSQQGEIAFLVTILRTNPLTHGFIRSRPNSLSELHDFLKTAGLDLLNHLRQQLQHWNGDPEFCAVKDAKLITLVLLPKSRSDGSDFETVEMRAFLTESSIVDIGIQIGIWDVFEGNVGQLITVDTGKTGESVQVSMLNPLVDFSPNQAALLSGLEGNKDLRVAAVGIGALGSQVILNLMRMGYGRWTLIDQDVLLPHNLARHALTRHFVGHSKSVGLAVLANQLMDNSEIALPLAENLLRPSEPDKLAAALCDAEVILDISTSIAAARHLTHDIDAVARRISLFLNPTATDVVILAEDRKREFKLDMLEMQYYRGLVQNPDLEGHLERGDERVRYGTSCRDLSSRIPQDLVALQSAICSRALRRIIEDDEATIVVWSTDLENVTTQKHTLSIGRVTEIEFTDWKMITDSVFLEKISQMRTSKLPNETGGVLIGSYDTARRIVYVVDTIPAPPDSEEWPTVFIRGSQGLTRKVEQVRSITEDQLDYVGEWHSHPPGGGCNPSTADLKAFSWLSEMMASEGLPALMLIAADNSECAFFLGQMEAVR